MRFFDRRDAGEQLGARVASRRVQQPIVIGLARGGVPVAAEVARHLHAPLDVFVVRKLGHPAQPELGVGAIAEGGIVVHNEELLATTGVREADLAHVTQTERRELDRRITAYRGGRPLIDVAGRTAVLVDDGIATGSTARAAISALRAHGAAAVVLAVPVASADAHETLRPLVDDLVCLHTPTAFGAVGEYYDDFGQVSDDDIREILATSDTAANGDDPPTITTTEHWVTVDGATLPVTLEVPAAARGLVVFAHGSGSTRHSPRNAAVARVLHAAGFATVRFDLLSADEARDRSNVFDIETLAARLIAVTAWLRRQPTTGRLAVGYFGASTGAAAALVAAARLGHTISAVVSRGGRPDLAADSLDHVTAPTLLIVGGDDDVVVDLNARASRHLHGVHELVVIPGATHLFEEPGALDDVAARTRDWFTRFLSPTRSAPMT